MSLKLQSALKTQPIMTASSKCPKELGQKVATVRQRGTGNSV